MERKKLQQARENRNLSQREVAEALGCSIDALSFWERGISFPQQHWMKKLCEFYGKSRKELDLGDDPPITEGELIMLQKKLESLGRRQLIELLSGLSLFAGVDLLALAESSMRSAPDKFLDQCNAAISGCWHLMKHGGMAYVDSILSICLPELSEFANQEGDYQHLAASLAMQGKTLRGLLAMHKLDYMSVEIYLASAVRFARLSGNRRLLVTSLAHQGDIYAIHLPDAERAKPLYEEAMGLLDRNALLNKASLSIGLADIHALNGDEDKATELIKQAKAAMPEYPELDPFYPLIDFGKSDLDRSEGRVYLYLSEHISDKGYAESAYNAFLRGTSKSATSSRSQSQTLIHLADAAVALNDLPKFTESLGQGIDIAKEIDSKIRRHEAGVVLGKAPESWHHEQRYQDLVKMF
jgi:transcriptional regulator with XRE-family HTH domain